MSDQLEALRRTRVGIGQLPQEWLGREAPAAVRQQAPDPSEDSPGIDDPVARAEHGAGTPATALRERPQE